MSKYCGIAVFFLFIAATIGCDAKVTGLSLHPESHDFGTVNLGDKQLMHFRVKNLSNNTFTITGIQIMGVSVSNFRITSGYAVPKYLQSQGFIIISIEYMPLNAGLHVAFIQISHTGPKRSERINLLGTGFPVARMNISTVNIDFGVVYVTRSGVEEIVLENVGTDMLIISSLNFENPTITEFTVKSGGTIPIMINQGESHTIEVEMTPPNDANYNNVLLISHNAVDKISPVRVILQGEGVTYAPEMDLNQTSPWDFGIVATTLPGIFRLEISSVGNDDLTLTSFLLQTGTTFSFEGLIDSNGNDLNLPQVVAIGDTVYAKIGFTPTANTTYNDTLTIIHDAINHNIPLVFELEGEGHVPIVRTFNYTGSIENWTVPAGVSSIRIEAWGGQGGGHSGGKGARVRGDFTVTPGETLKIIAAENGYVTAQGPNYGAGGGGGSFVYRNATDSFPLIAAGGGGGQAQNNPGADASGTQTPTAGSGTGSGTGGTGGNGGDGGRDVANYSTGGGGCGWLTDGKDGIYIRNPEGKGGKCPKNGAAGGIFTHNSASFCVGKAGDGGFGGGGGMSDNSGAGGGGGGWNGGGGGNNYTGTWGTGGGAGSYNGGSNQSNSSGVNTTHGKVIITY
ncbi:MAG: choice-of-anchor D domain-containing protein [Planctomycetes bacterium]|nr:choice-of-anchor D domain-containing protein [Planctomycetota bacterium]